jgi:hypothetical protein
MAIYRSVKVVASQTGFIGNEPEIGTDGCNRIPAGLKSFQLRMKPVAVRFPLKHFLGEQAFAPESN